MNDPWTWCDAELTCLQEQGLRRTLQTRRSRQRGDAIRLGETTLINFGSNDYLGLASDERLLLAAREAMASEGWGAGASPLVTGRSAWHEKLETMLADFEQGSRALLFPTGYAANVGTIQALVGKEDVIFSDAKNHASLIDGCRLSPATVHIYRHNDVDHLNQLLREHRSARRSFIVTDSLFSMDGDFAPLVELVSLAERYDAFLLVDEAHATGVWGDEGRGLVEHCGVDARRLIRIGTLSKALGSHGGFVVSDARCIDYLVNKARPYIFSTASPAALAATSCRAIEIIRAEPERRQKVQATAALLRVRLQERGWSLGQSVSQIVPILLGDPERTMRYSQRLREAGLYVPGIRPPSVPAGESLLRASVTWHHEREHVERLVEALETLRSH